MPGLHYVPAAARTLRCLEKGRRADAVKLRRVRRALGQLAADPRHPLEELFRRPVGAP